jgi:hypothetical protein
MERTYTTPLLDKLGVRRASRVALVGLDDAGFQSALAERTDDITVGDPLPETDLVFLAADLVNELFELSRLEPRLRSNGAIWVVSRKGKGATLRDIDVIDAAKSAGLIDNKVVSFSEIHTALRLVIPLIRRGRR